MIRNLPAIRETRVPSLAWEDNLQEGMATHSSILAWRIPGTEVPGRLQRIGHDGAALSFKQKVHAKILEVMRVTCSFPHVHSNKSLEKGVLKHCSCHSCVVPL